MSRKAFYSFHFKPDSWRASQVRNIGVVDGNQPVSDNDWEDVKKGGDSAIQEWIDDQLAGRSCTIVLIGENTAGRKWINLGTHFDVMNKEFPLEYTERKGIVFDVSKIKDRDIDIADIDMNKVTKDIFVCFYTGFIEEEGYGTKKYFTEHPQLSNELLEALLQKNVSIIGVDFAGVRRGKEHTPMDQYCANHGQRDRKSVV